MASNGGLRALPAVLLFPGCQGYPTPATLQCACAGLSAKRQRISITPRAVAEPKMMLQNGLVDYYEVLGVSRSAGALGSGHTQRWGLGLTVAKSNR